MSVENRFWSKVDIRGDNDCWNWLAGKTKKGYGLFKAYKKTWQAHRFSYFLSRNITNTELYVLHSCDNPACVNPNHLRLGTHIDNMNDRMIRERTPKGIKNGSKTHPERVVKGEDSYRTNLKNEDVIKIKTLLIKDILSLVEIAKLFNTTPKVIGYIKSGHTWKHVGIN